MPPQAITQLVTPLEPFAVEWDGFPQVFNPGRVFEPKHPLVKAYPSRFKTVEPQPMDRVGAGIEQATAEPGELRNR